MKKPDDFIDDDDDDYALIGSGYGNDPNVITDVELEVQSTPYKKVARSFVTFAKFQADDLTKICNNLIIHKKAQHACTTT